MSFRGDSWSVLLVLVILTCTSFAIELNSVVYNKVIKVNCSSSGACDGLSAALGQAQTVKGSVLIQLTSGTFSLNSSENASFVGSSDLAIAGAGSSLTTIKCDKNEKVGFTFINSTRLAFVNVTFLHCGALQNSTSKNTTKSILASTTGTMSFLRFRAAVYFLFCTDITMQHVTVKFSPGSGVVLYNTNGTNSFTDSKFLFNQAPIKDRLPGGTGLSIDFSYCTPGDIHCRDDSVSKISVSRSNYTFADCSFSYNNASSLSDKIVYPHGTDHMTFGKGGGVSVYFGGQAIENSIQFRHCTFDANVAKEAGGLYVKFGDISLNNKLAVVDSDLTSNTLDCGADQWTIGGGAKIDFIHYPPDDDLWPGYNTSVQENSVVFMHSRFTANIACCGGAVSFVSSRELYGTNNSNSLLFDSCEFSSNVANNRSAAVDLSVLYPDAVGNPGGLIQPSFRDCNFTGNEIQFVYIHNFPLGIGSLYANGIPVKLSGKIKFVNNKETAMVVSSTHVDGMESSLIEFNGNKGRLGGAVALFGNSQLIARKNSTYSFVNNSVRAGGLGGAIYSAHFGEHDFRLQQNCFFQYYKATIPPQNWIAKFIFANNSAASRRNSIYTTSVLPCLWPTDDSSDDVLSSVFCGGHPWYFNGSNCKEEVSTAANTFQLPNSTKITAVPGWPTNIGITTFDDYQNKIPTVLVAFPDDGSENVVEVDTSTEYISNDKIILHGMENQSTSLRLRTLDPRVIVSRLKVDIFSCPPGFVSVRCNDSDMTCNCSCPSASDGISCDIDKHSITIYSYYCLTYQYQDGRPNTSLSLVFGKCPYNRQTHKLPMHADQLDDLICGPLNRTGVLCSQCNKSHGVAINSHYQCVPCNPATGWLLFLVVKILPVTVVFILVALLNIKATSAALNGFVFYSQIISISYFYNPYPFFFGVLKFDDTTTRRLLVALVEFVHGIFNLDFFRGIVPPFCVGFIDTLPAIAINYVVAIYPLLLIVLCYMCIKLYDRNFRPIRILWRPFRWCLSKLHAKKKPTTSIIDAFATFILLSYTNFLYVSFPLVQPLTVQNASSSDRIPVYDHPKFYFDASVDAFGSPLAVILTCVVIVVITVFVVGPSLFLILYPLKCVQSCISRLPRNIALKTFAESFMGCFRNGTERSGGRDCRYFAGLYFLFRIAIFAVFVSELDWAEQYFVQQVLFTVGMVLFAVARPYKNDYYNNLDMGIFALLSLQNVCSFYNSQLILSGHHISIPVFVVNYILLFIPLMYIIGYTIYYCLFTLHCLSWCSKKESKSSESIVIISDSTEDPFSYVYNHEDSQEDDEDFPDRVLHPQNYRRISNRAAAPKIVITKATGEREPNPNKLEVSTENSYFLERERQREFQAYGTIDCEYTDSRSHSEPRPKPRQFRKLV